MGLVMGFVGPNGSGSTWDGALFRDLLGRFAIDLSARVETLSRDEGVKLSLAMALAHRPEVLILDEPTSGLDPVSRADLVDILREFMVDPVHCILFSTAIDDDSPIVMTELRHVAGHRSAVEGALTTAPSPFLFHAVGAVSRSTREQIEHERTGRLPSDRRSRARQGGARHRRRHGWPVAHEGARDRTRVECRETEAGRGGWGPGHGDATLTQLLDANLVKLRNNGAFRRFGVGCC